MQAIREYAVVKNGQLVLNLPRYFEQSEVEVIVLQKYGPEVCNAFAEKKSYQMGILKGKTDYAVKDGFKLTDETFLRNDAKETTDGLAEMKSRIQHTIDKFLPDELESVLKFLKDLQKAGGRDEWDRQIARDFDEGNLDFLIREADAAMENKDIQPWP
ncbi:MAG TPA: hypothetical protein ENK58_02325 [Desulfobacterales bacterium]|nr:MAG: hypothetical protein DRI57_04140 [Deltaproteobacteria bacterium]HHC24241.1 hypothetical protein [Desulfobacterales bacterium]